MITEESKCITILAFNYGAAGKVVNGPGICLFNFIKILKKEFPYISINLFTQLRSADENIFYNTHNIKNTALLKESIKKSLVVHHWSGISDIYSDIISFANLLGKTVLIGPNVIDTVEYQKEKRYLSRVKFNKILTVNKRLRFKISKEHDIPIGLVRLLMIGPDLDLWRPSEKNNGKILWKGNSRQFVKDIEFGIKVSEKLNKYEFSFLGYPEPYDYFGHIDFARDCKLYFSTSLSETMGMSLVEQWACGIPSVTHPNIYLHGSNYETGIIASRTINDYCDAISEIMENDTLYHELSGGCVKFVQENFNHNLIIKNYLNLLNPEL